MTKYTKNMVGLFIAGFLITVIGGYVIGKLDLYKREIERLHGYHSAVINRQQEDIEILFNRCNLLEAKLQRLTEEQ